MDDEALARTLATGRATYWSRSRGEYWVKGETSGHRQWVKAVRLDCDGDTVLLQVDQEGPACHTGARTCFDADLLWEADAESEAGMADGRRLFAPTVLLGLAGSGLAALAGGKPWAAPDSHAGSTLVDHSRRPRAAGRRTRPGRLWRAGASSWSPAAGYAVRSPPWARWSPSGLVATVGPRPRVRRSTRPAHATVDLGTRRPSRTRHRLVVGRRSSARVLWRSPRRCSRCGSAPRWPEMGSRYDAPTGRPGRRPEDLDDLDLWRAIDQGHDPTDPTDH